jgi:hypothetical protein
MFAPSLLIPQLQLQPALTPSCSRSSPVFLPSLGACRLRLSSPQVASNSALRPLLAGQFFFCSQAGAACWQSQTSYSHHPLSLAPPGRSALNLSSLPSRSAPAVTLQIVRAAIQRRHPYTFSEDETDDLAANRRLLYRLCFVNRDFRVSFALPAGLPRRGGFGRPIGACQPELP